MSSSGRSSCVSSVMEPFTKVPSPVEVPFKLALPLECRLLLESTSPVAHQVGIQNLEESGWSK